MPTYEYECQTCGKRFDLFQSMKDPKLQTCPTSICQNGGTVKRLLGTGGGIIFKGGGFYQTDYRSESYQSGAKKDTASTSDTPKAAESKPTPPAASSSSSSES